MNSKNEKLNAYDFDRSRAIGNYIVKTHLCPSKEGMRPPSRELRSQPLVAPDGRKATNAQSLAFQRCFT
jgi:hypothetical protein